MCILERKKNNAVENKTFNKFQFPWGTWGKNVNCKMSYLKNKESESEDFINQILWCSYFFWGRGVKHKNVSAIKTK